MLNKPGSQGGEEVTARVAVGERLPVQTKQAKLALRFH